MPEYFVELAHGPAAVRGLVATDLAGRHGVDGWGEHDDEQRPAADQLGHPGEVVAEDDVLDDHREAAWK
ncbi:MAG: hypothetical protein ACRDT2_21935 [Natronosporangium sp.]